MSDPDRSPGWDKRAVNRIAKDTYGGLAAMFKAHGWHRDGRTYGQVAPTRVKQTYGSVAAFERLHLGRAVLNPLLHPLAALEMRPPQVWLTSYYGFDPANWGMLPFTYESERDKFIERSVPGALVAIYGTKDLEDESHAGLVIGVMQVTHVVGPSKDFVEPAVWREKERDDAPYWNHGVKCIRAWEIPLEHRPYIDDFAPDTYSPAFAQTIGRRGRQMSRREARKLLKLPLVEIPVYGGEVADICPVESGEDALKPSKPGPVSKRPKMVREAEGKKHLYILRLHGRIDEFIGKPLKRRRIVKVGFSVSPDMRRKALNSALPGRLIRWEIERSTFDEEREPFPSSDHALAGEAAMKSALLAQAESLGNEFFLASDKAIEEAWREGIRAAGRFKG